MIADAHVEVGREDSVGHLLDCFRGREVLCPVVHQVEDTFQANFTGTGDEPLDDGDATAVIWQVRVHGDFGEMQTEGVGNREKMLVTSAIKTKLKNFMRQLVEVVRRVDVLLDGEKDDLQILLIIARRKEHRLGENELHVQVVILNAPVELIVTLLFDAGYSRLVLN